MYTRRSPSENNVIQVTYKNSFVSDHQPTETSYHSSNAAIILYIGKIYINIGANKQIKTNSSLPRFSTSLPTFFFAQ